MSAVTKKKLIPAANAAAIVAGSSTMPTQKGLTRAAPSGIRSVSCGSESRRGSFIAPASRLSGIGHR
jgi:hypothetical protein